MWLVAVGVALGGLAILAVASRRWRIGGRRDFGWMSQQWLAEHRSGGSVG